MAGETRYTMREIEAMTGANARTIRFYITEGLLAPAHGRGPAARYDDGHLNRLRMIQSLKNDRLGLADIRERLGTLSDRDVAAMAMATKEPDGDLWRKVVLHPDIELHVRERTGHGVAELQDVVDLLIAQARPLVARLGKNR